MIKEPLGVSLVGATRRRKYPKSPPGRKIAAHPAACRLASSPARDWWVLRFDGGVSGNGRPDARGRWAFRVTAGGVLLREDCGTATGALVTVNTAEYDGLCHGLLWLAELVTGAVPGVLIEGDSDLIVSQVTGRWKAQGELLVRRDECLDLIEALWCPWHARWIPRELNHECDRLCSMAGVYAAST